MAAPLAFKADIYTVKFPLQQVNEFPVGSKSEGLDDSPHKSSLAVGDPGYHTATRVV